MTIEHIKLDDNLKPKKSINILNIISMLITLSMVVMSFFAIWGQEIYTKIFLTLLVIVIFLSIINSNKK